MTDKPAKTGERKVLDLLDGFIATKVLMTAFQLDLFTPLAERAMTVDEILALRNLPLRTGTILIQSAQALGLLEDAGEGRVRVPADVAPFLRKGPGEPFRVATYLIDYYDAVYADLVRMDEIVKTNGASSGFKLRDYFKEDVNEVDPAVAADYSAYMDATMAKIVETVLETTSFAGAKQLVDLCGGPGTFAMAVARATPGLRAAFLDVPAVVATSARALAASLDLAARVTPIAGDVFTTPLPAGVDTITMCRSAHDWDDERVKKVFARAYQALPAGGRFLVIERMIPEAFSAAAAKLYLRSVYFMVKSQTALYRTPEQYQAMLGRAGFTQVRTLKPGRDAYEFFPGLQIVEARK